MDSIRSLKSAFGRPLLAVLAWGTVLGLAGAPARAAGAEPLPAPAAQPPGGVFVSNVNVTLALPGGGTGAVLRFTVDGTDPGTNATAYTGPLALTHSTLVQARAFGPDGAAGPLLAATFTLLETNLADFDSNLPLVILHTFGRGIAPGSNTPASLRLIAPGPGGRARLTGAPDFDGRAGCKTRGYSSLRYPKRSLGVETRTAEGQSLDVSLLGLPADSDWILYAPYPDKSLVRDVLAYEISNQMGRYASRTRFVEVFLHEGAGRLDRSNYAGVYVLEEKVKRSPHRVAVQKLGPDDQAEPAVTGGYLFKKDHLEEAGGAGDNEAPARAKSAGWQLGLPSGPGGFPADPAAFLPSAPPAALAHALVLTTNLTSLTNTVGGSTVVAPAWALTLVATNTVLVTNTLAVTNTTIATNLVVTTNALVSTNLTVATTPVLVTNTAVATQAATATNTLATTNAVDPLTTVVTTTTTLLTTTTYRTNFIPATNLVSVTNISLATVSVTLTNPVVTTNSAVASLALVSTNVVLETNTLVFGSTASPHLPALVASGQGFVTRQTNAFFFYEPKDTRITPAQRAWLTQHLDQVEQALHGPDFRDPAKGYAAFLDADSFVDHHLIVEASKNIDGFRFSTYFSKDRGGKIRMEPIWDWNLSFGNSKGKQGHLWDRWYWPQLDDMQYTWFRRLFEDPDFAQRYVDRYAAWRTNVLSTRALTERIDAHASLLREAATRNFARWPILGDSVGPEYFVGKTWDEELTYLKGWITNRLGWMDTQFVAAPIASLPGGLIYSTNTLILAAPAGEVFYTTDGSDPRAPGGAVAPGARPADGPLALPPAMSVTLTTRTRRDQRWSAPITLQFMVKPAPTSGAGG
ncbi:MAG: hypothetical protein RJA22_296 [Verrucomicrobiota bacterium]